MNVSVPSILLTLGGKCLISWVLVALQSHHISKSFLGVFSVSLAVVDTTLTLAVTAIHLHADGCVVLLGSQFTRYHVCLLVQILGQVYIALQWPVVVFAGLDHLCTVTQRFQPNATRARWILYLSVTTVLWYLSAVYTFLLSGFIPVLEDVSHNQIHQCWVFHTSQMQQVAISLLLALGCTALHAACSTLKGQFTDQSGTHCRGSVVRQAVRIFLDTWALFLFLLAALLLLPVGIPAYLGLNTAWLCFLNSLLIALVLCVVRPACRLAQGLAAVPPDSFCEWRFKFSLAAKGRSELHQANTAET